MFLFFFFCFFSKLYATQEELWWELVLSTGFVLTRFTFSGIQSTFTDLKSEFGIFLREKEKKNNSRDSHLKLSLLLNTWHQRDETNYAYSWTCPLLLYKRVSSHTAQMQSLLIILLLAHVWRNVIYGINFEPITSVLFSVIGSAELANRKASISTASMYFGFKPKKRFFSQMISILP